MYKKINRNAGFLVVLKYEPEQQLYPFLLLIESDTVLAPT